MNRMALAGGIVALTVSALAAAQAPAPIDLTVKFDRPTPIYALDDQLTLSITVARSANVRIWLRDPTGKIAPLLPSSAEGEPLHVNPGEIAHVPRRGTLRVTPPAGRYELLLTAEAATGGSRSILDADSRLAGGGNRQQMTIAFRVEE